MEPGAPPHHLAVKASHFRRPEDHHAVHTGAVPALGEEHGVAEHVIFTVLEVPQNLRPVLTVAVDLRRPEAVLLQNVPEFLGSFHQGQEHDGPAAFAVLPHLGGDLM